MRVVHVYHSNAGVAAGMLSILFGIIGILTFGLIFVPLAFLFSFVGFVGGLGMLRGFTDISGTGMLVSLVGGILGWIGFLVSPSLWLVVGGAALVGAAHAPTPRPMPAIEAPSENERAAAKASLSEAYKKQGH
jgi:hypothetical protein